jgi:hypothetical protein
MLEPGDSGGPLNLGPRTGDCLERLELIALAASVQIDADSLPDESYELSLLIVDLARRQTDVAACLSLPRILILRRAASEDFDGLSKKYGWPNPFAE